MISIGTFNEESTGAFDCAFTDENLDPTPPKTVTWTITDRYENVINSREQVEVASPSEITTITIWGDDLKLLENETGRYADRFIVIEATYDSDLGIGLPLKEQGFFQVKNLKYVGKQE